MCGGKKIGECFDYFAVQDIIFLNFIYEIIITMFLYKFDNTVLKLIKKCYLFSI